MLLLGPWEYISQSECTRISTFVQFLLCRLFGSCWYSGFPALQKKQKGRVGLVKQQNMLTHMHWWPSVDHIAATLRTCLRTRVEKSSIWVSRDDFGRSDWMISPLTCCKSTLCSQTSVRKLNRGQSEVDNVHSTINWSTPRWKSGCSLAQRVEKASMQRRDNIFIIPHSKTSSNSSACFG